MAATKILIVDDDPDILTVLEQRLLPCGYEVLKASDGEEAVIEMKSGKPDLIIMDVLMPKMTGYDALRKIREDAELRKIPAIIISARGVMRDFFTDLPRVEFIPKPYDAKDLLVRISRLLGTPAVSANVSQVKGPDIDVSTTSNGKRRAVIVLGVQDGLVTKIQTKISSMGIEVDRALNEDDACKVAQKMRPEKIFCQFWEDHKILDAQKLFEQFSKTPSLSGISFYVFCEVGSSLEALKVFKEEKIISYHETSDLLEKISDVLKTTV